MTDREKPPKPKFWTRTRVFAILAALFTSIGIYFYAKHITPLTTGIALVIGFVFIIVLLRAPKIE